MPVSIVSGCNQNSFKSKKDRLFKSPSNNGKWFRSVAVSQIISKKNEYLVISSFFCLVGLFATKKQSNSLIIAEVPHKAVAEASKIGNL